MMYWEIALADPKYEPQYDPASNIYMQQIKLKHGSAFEFVSYRQYSKQFKLYPPLRWHGVIVHLLP